MPSIFSSGQHNLVESEVVHAEQAGDKRIAQTLLLLPDGGKPSSGSAFRLPHVCVPSTGSPRSSAFRDPHTGFSGPI